MSKKINVQILKKIFVIIAIGLILFAVVRLLILFFPFVIEPSQVFLLKQEVLKSEEIQDALILREEYVLNDNNDKLIEKEKFEGEKVGKNVKIFRYYSENENEKIKRISEINKEIEKYLIEQKENLGSTENKRLEKKIEEKLLDLNDLNQQSKIMGIEKKIADEILEKAKLSGDLSKEGSKIKNLIDSKNNLERQLKDDTEDVYAPISGVVSYRVDGFEKDIDIKNLQQIDDKKIAKIDIKSGSVIPESNAKCKIVDNFYTYLVFKTKSKEGKSAKIGDKIKVRINNENEIDATVNNIIDTGKDKRIIILRINTDTINLLKYRKTRIEIIWWSDKGLKVRNDSIFKEGEYNYVIRNYMGTKEKMLVKILKQTNEFSLIDNYTTEELKKMGLDISEDRKTISVNDEIVVNPKRVINKVTE